MYGLRVYKMQLKTKEKKVKKDNITVEAWVHWKQGDEFADFVKEFSTPKALEMWGLSLIERGKILVKGSEILAGQELKVDSDTHHIAIYDVDREIADELFKLGIFHQDQLEKEHEECDGCEECSPEAYYE